MSKYNAIKTEIDGRVFASRAEARRYSELCLLEHAEDIADRITGLECQPIYQLFINKKHICNYIADFRYTTYSGAVIVEDVKGVKTPVYRLKKKMVEAAYNIKITEVT
jgi:hypothetical protein